MPFHSKRTHLLYSAALAITVNILGLSWSENSVAQTTVAPKRYALLIAVNKYEDAKLNQPPLQYPESDAKEISERLREGGYDVDLLLGPKATKAAIERKLAAMNLKGNDDGAVVIGLFGHGVEYAGTDEAMYCPYDSAMRLAKDASGNQLFEKAENGGGAMIEPDPKSLIGMSSILNSLKLCKAGNKLLLADCCRKSPNAARGRAFGSSVKLSDLPNKTAAIFACSVGEEAQEHEDWKHGAMTRAFLDLLPEISGEGNDVNRITGRMSDSVAAMVQEVTQGRKNQTLNPIVKGVVKLKLNVPKLDAQVSDFTNSLGMKLVRIKAGTFMMGSPASEAGRIDENQVRVTLTSDYWLGSTEVTQGQWKTLMNTAPWKGKVNVEEGTNFAASGISWDDATSFMNKLTDRERQSGTLPIGYEYALPSEAQWEYACRGGQSTAYSFGEDAGELAQYAWYDKNGWAAGERYAHEVGMKKANPFGLYDMHGNVWEWCRDNYEEKLSGGANPFVENKGSDRVFRGGSCFHSARSCRSAFRLRGSPDFRDYYLGFRVSLVPTVR